MGKLSFEVSARASSCLAVTVVTALTLVGCSGGKEPSATEPATSQSARPSPSHVSDRAEHTEGETVSRAPKPVDDGPVLLSVASKQGNAELPLTKEIGAGMLAIQVNCQGKGTLDVTVDPLGLSFPLNCVNEEVSSTYNEVHLKRARSEGTVRVSAPSTVRWALTAEQ